MPRVIGISEGMVLAERYRLVRRHEDLGTGEFWGGVDQETGSEVWVCFADRPGLGEIAERMRTWKSPAAPRVLDSGEVRLILDSRALGVAGARGRAATHVEVVVEFAVQEPALGKPLPGRFVRRPLTPAEALGIVALLAGALEEAREAGCSHGWISAASVWSLRRRACLVDLVAGLATPDSAKIEVAAQVSGYYAPERIAGGGASEAADVFALGWLLYASLVGQANLGDYYHEAVAAAGSASTAELLVLWRERSREHMRALLAENAALAELLLGALAERPADRLTLAAFRAAATEAARTHAGAAALVAYQPKKRAGAVAAAAALGVAAVASTAALAADVASGGVEGEGGVEVEAEAGGEVEGEVEGGAASEAQFAEESIEAVVVAESVGAADVAASGERGAGGAGGAGTSGASGAAGAGAGTSGTEAAVAASAGAGALMAEAVAVEGLAAAVERSRRPKVGAGLLIACAVALLAIGMGSGYAFGMSGSRQTASSALSGESGIGLGAVAAATSSAACAPNASASAAVSAASGSTSAANGSASAGAAAAALAAAATTGATTTTASRSTTGATTTGATATASPSTTATWDENAALPLPTSTAAAVAQLTQIVRGAEGSGLISSGTASTLSGEIAALQGAIASGSGEGAAWRTLSQSIAGGRNQGTIPQALSLQLVSALSYLGQAAGS
jgi:hypothetical protein